MGVANVVCVVDFVPNVYYYPVSYYFVICVIFEVLIVLGDGRGELG